MLQRAGRNCQKRSAIEKVMPAGRAGDSPYPACSSRVSAAATAGSNPSTSVDDGPQVIDYSPCTANWPTRPGTLGCAVAT